MGANVFASRLANLLAKQVFMVEYTSKVVYNITNLLWRTNYV
jgi:hypothetical protein